MTEQESWIFIIHFFQLKPLDYDFMSKEITEDSWATEPTEISASEVVEKELLVK